MRGKLTFVAGAAIGFILGARAGREKYEDIVEAAKKVIDSPSVHEASGVMQSQASKLYAQSKDTLSNAHVGDKLRNAHVGDKLRNTLGRRKDDMDDMLSDNGHQHMTSNSF